MTNSNIAQAGNMTQQEVVALGPSKVAIKVHKEGIPALLDGEKVVVRELFIRTAGKTVDGVVYPIGGDRIWETPNPGYQLQAFVGSLDDLKIKNICFMTDLRAIIECAETMIYGWQAFGVEDD